MEENEEKKGLNTIFSNEEEKLIARHLYNRGKKFIDQSDFRHIDRTAFIFITMLKELNAHDLATDLHNHYLRE